MAVLLQMDGAETWHLVRVLVHQAEACKDDPDFAELHSYLLTFLRAVSHAQPLVITDDGRAYLVAALNEQERRHGQSAESRSIIRKLMPSTAEVEAERAEPWRLD